MAVKPFAKWSRASETPESSILSPSAMQASLMIWAQKRSRPNLWEVWMDEATSEWLAKQAGVTVVREAPTKGQYVVFIDPRYRASEFEKFVEFCNMETVEGVH